VATSVRWASDRSVYLARLHDGVSEVALDGRLSRLHVVVPDAKTMHAHFTTFSRLAASPQVVATSSLLVDFAFRPAAAAADGTFVLTNLRVGIAYAYDVWRDRLVFVGDLHPGAQRSAGVVWYGPLSAHPQRDLRPLLLDAASAGTATTPGLIHCDELQLGAARFLADGSFVVVPGFQSGLHLYGANGELLRVWQNEDAGFDAPDCAGMSQQEADRYSASPPARFEFVNRYRVVDEILPLPAGPGLVVRYVTDGGVHWALRLLRLNGEILTYALPFTGNDATDRLRGDVRGNRIVLLLAGSKTARELPDPPGKLYVIEAPQVLPEVAR
jgi:hypothetical protein